MAIDRSVARQGGALRSVTSLRWILVLCLVAFQSMEVSESYGRVANTALWVIPVWGIAALFALGGYTGMRSIERNGLAVAAKRSAWRFLPALGLILLVTAFGLGFALTTESRGNYLLDSDTFGYLLNLLGVARLRLPGLFEFNASAGIVNPIVWTIPIAYVAAALLALTAPRPRYRNWILIGFGVALAAGGVAAFLTGAILDTDTFLGSVLLGQGLGALLCFVVGALLFRTRTRVRIDWRIAAVFGVALLIVANLGDRSWGDNALCSVGTAIPIGYLAIYACSLPLPLRHSTPLVEPLLWRVFLLAYPVQQSWIAVGPDRQSGIVNLILSLPVILALAAGEWFLVERPLFRRFLPGVLRPVAAPASGPRVNARTPIEHARDLLPALAGALFVILLMLGALVITMFAMQRDAGGA